MKNYLINSEVVQSILKYMFTRPYGEVYKLMEVVLKLEENKNESGQKQETKKV